MKKIIVFLVFLSSTVGFAQKVTFPKWGDFSEFEKNLVHYKQDTTAHAVVLNEVGYAYIEDGGSYQIIKKIYRRIKILDKEGFDQANVKLFSNQDYSFSQIKASTTNFINGKKVVSTLSSKDIFKKKESEDEISYSFTLPNIQVGSIIEYSYRVNTNYRYNFGGAWFFQNSIPTIKSSYYAKIPGFWTYYIATRNITNPVFDQNILLSNCMRVNGSITQCLFIEFSLENIPAFIEEDFMTDSKNYLQQITFELKTFTNTDGMVTQINKSWRDTDKRIIKNQEFGKKYLNSKFLKKQLPSNIMEETDKLSKAKKVYTFIKNHFTWDGTYHLFDYFNDKRAFEEKQGSMVEININLIHALLAAGIDADFALLSTRENGFVSKIYPVTSDFNYLVAHCKINGKDYFLDATQKNLPFGMLPYRCLNNDIRVFNKVTGSYWVDYKPYENNSTIVYNSAIVSEDGEVSLNSRMVYYGYTNYLKRNEIKDKSIATYKEETVEELNDAEIIEHKIKNLDDLDKPLIEELEIDFETDFVTDGKIYIKPFVINSFKQNPFQLKERQYPVDFGFKRSFKYHSSLTFPDHLEVVALPKNRRIRLLNQGGILVYLSEVKNNIVTSTLSLTLNKTFYGPETYINLKALMKELINAQNEMIVLDKK